MKGLDKVLLCVSVLVVLFIISMEVMYYIVGGVPDSLVVGVLGTGGTECVCCMLVYYVKHKFKREDDDSDV